ncbi:MAG: hypothetical protein FJ288_12470 [Planctomycetes bacterium]|nr:hypothetical protein [Planctomycetota bacterium]
MTARFTIWLAAVAGLAFGGPAAPAADWPQWGGQPGKNMVSAEKGLPDSFVPGEKDPQGAGILMETTRNVRWAVRTGGMTCSTPAVAGGRVFIGTLRDGHGALLCLDERTGKPLWEWTAPTRDVPTTIDGRRFEFSRFPRQLGVCSSPAVDGDRVYFVTHRLEVLCLSTRGRPKTSPAAAAGAGAMLSRRCESVDVARPACPAPPAGGQVVGNIGDALPRPDKPAVPHFLVSFAPPGETYAGPAATAPPAQAPPAPATEGKPASAPPAKVRWPQGPGEAEVIWTFDIWDMGVRPSDACDCSPVFDERFLYVCTANGVDRQAESKVHDEFRAVPAPDAPNVIVLDKKTGRLVAMDGVRFPERMFHGQWSSLALGKVGGRTLIFFGGGDGRCYAFEAPAAEAPASPGRSPPDDKPATLKLAWSVDCNPKEYQVFGDMPMITHYCLGDRRRSDGINKKGDGSFVGMSEIIATPVFHNGRVYVAIGRDPEHGRGRGALWCIDAAKTGDITETGRVWCYQGLDRTLSTVSIAGGLLYVADVGGRLHCLDADTGQCHWVHETGAKAWGSTLAADGKVYMPTDKGLWVLAAGKEQKVIGKIILGAPAWASPVAADGVLYVASTNYLWAVAAKP